MNDLLLNKLKKEEQSILDFIDDVCKKNNIDYFLLGGTLLGAVRHKGFIPWDDDIDIGMFRDDYNRFITCFNLLNSDNYFLDSFDSNSNYWLPYIKIRIKNSELVEDLQEFYNGPKGIWIDVFPIDNGSVIDRIRFPIVSSLRVAISYKSNIKVIYNKCKTKPLIFFFRLFPKKVLYRIQNFIMTFNKDSNSKYTVNLGSQYGYSKQRHLREDYIPTKKLLFEGKYYNCPGSYDKVLRKIYGNNYMDLPPVEKRITHNPLKVKFRDGEEVFFDEKI